MYEYRILFSEWKDAAEKLLNQMSRDGWKLVSASCAAGFTFVFERKLDAPAD